MSTRLKSVLGLINGVCTRAESSSSSSSSVSQKNYCRPENDVNTRAEHERVFKRNSYDFPSVNHRPPPRPPLPPSNRSERNGPTDFIAALSHQSIVRGDFKSSSSSSLEFLYSPSTKNRYPCLKIYK